MINQDEASIELRINSFLETESVFPVNLHDYLKDLSVYQEKINLKSNLSIGSSPEGIFNINSSHL